MTTQLETIIGHNCNKNKIYLFLKKNRNYILVNTIKLDTSCPKSPYRARHVVNSLLAHELKNGRDRTRGPMSRWNLMRAFSFVKFTGPSLVLYTERYFVEINVLLSRYVIKAETGKAIKHETCNWSNYKTRPGTLWSAVLRVAAWLLFGDQELSSCKFAERISSLKRV